MPKPSRTSKTARALESRGSGAEVETLAGPRRRTFTAEYKRRIVTEANACTEPGEVGALLRGEGLYSSHLAVWRREFEAGATAALAGRKPGRKPKKDPKERRIEELEKEKARLEHELRVARALLGLQKKSLGALGDHPLSPRNRRRVMIEAIEELDDPAVPVVAACDALGVSRATLYRHTSPPRPRSLWRRPPSHRRISEPERQCVVDVMNSEEFIDQPPREVYAALLSLGIYLVSVRTMYRILAERGEARERRAQRPAKSHAVPRVTAAAPNQVWTWDITKLATTTKGVFLSLYVIMDLFSRYVVGWMVAERESRELAKQLFNETLERHGVKPGEVVVHSDRGSPMTSDTLAQLFATMGVTRSLSRPRVSNDNPFSEANFKTLKYQPDYPGRFEGVLDSRGWLQSFFSWHNDDHHHDGLALFTPADVFHGRVDEVAAHRQRALDAAYAAHPERFVHGPPVARRPPALVAINPLDPEELGGEVGSLSPDLVASIAPAKTAPVVAVPPRCDRPPLHPQHPAACS